jgi:hypothetical protein
MNPTLKDIPFLIAGSLLAMVSIYFSAVFWSSFVNGITNQVITAIIASALVACQYLFFSARKDHAGAIKHAHKLTVFVLFITSGAATIAWLESSYQANNKTELKSDVVYNQKVKHLASLNTKLATLNKNAAADTAAEFRARAKSTLRQAEQTEYKIEKLTREISQFKITSNNAGSTIANNLSFLRWFFWGLLAALIDICPMLCFANITPTKPMYWERGSRHELISEEVKNIITEKTVHCELAITVAEEIKANKYGEKPSVRAVMTAHNIRHDRAKLIFDQLTEMKIVTREGQRFKRIQHTQEQPA